MYTELENYIRQQVLPGAANITAERKDLLDKIATAARQAKDSLQTVELLFVCTHNSRRSQLAQAWAWVGTQWYNTNGIGVHSAGTEATAFHANAINALKRASLHTEDSNNHQVFLKVDDKTTSAAFFSKTTEHPSIPNNNLIAIMTCSDAEQNCPFIPGADARIPLRYTDPKISDGKPNSNEVYDNTCLLIATEIFYIFDQLN